MSTTASSYSTPDEEHMPVCPPSLFYGTIDYDVLGSHSITSRSESGTAQVGHNTFSTCAHINDEQTTEESSIERHSQNSKSATTPSKTLSFGGRNNRPQVSSGIPKVLLPMAYPRLPLTKMYQDARLRIVLFSRRLSRFTDNTNCVTIRTGSIRAFRAEIELLNSQSTYFNTMFSQHSPWIEVSSKSVEVKGFGRSAMAMFLLWSKDGHLAGLSSIVKSHSNTCLGITNILRGLSSAVGPLKRYMLYSEVNALVNAYILGDYLGAPRFQNCVMDEIVLRYEWMCSEGMSLHNIGHVFKRAPWNSKLREFTIDLVRYVPSNYILDATTMIKLPWDVVAAIDESALGEDDIYAINRPPWDLPKCKYHVNYQCRTSDERVFMNDCSCASWFSWKDFLDYCQGR